MHRCLCIALALLARLEAINDVSVWCSKFRLQKSQEFLSSLRVNVLCCFRAPVKGSIQACADRWTGLKTGSQGKCAQSWALCFFPVAFADAAPSWLTSLQVHSSAKLTAPGNFLTKFAKDLCSKNLIFQFWKKDVYSPHYCGITWKMYKTCQCCL